MPRKKWTPQTEVTDSLLKAREKRKWQIALRRYVLERNKSSFYAPYFGLDIDNFRTWLAIQFDDGTNWENFSQSWQLDHIIPVAYFNFDDDSDLRLCWNFTNIRIHKTGDNPPEVRGIDVIAAKAYFQRLFQQTGYIICKAIVEKIEAIEIQELANNEKLESFINNKTEYLESLITFSPHDFDNLNSGTGLKEILQEKELLSKFGK